MTLWHICVLLRQEPLIAVQLEQAQPTVWHNHEEALADAPVRRPGRPSDDRWSAQRKQQAGLR